MWGFLSEQIGVLAYATFKTKIPACFLRNPSSRITETSTLSRDEDWLSAEATHFRWTTTAIIPSAEQTAERSWHNSVWRLEHWLSVSRRPPNASTSYPVDDAIPVSGPFALANVVVYPSGSYQVKIVNPSGVPSGALAFTAL